MKCFLCEPNEEWIYMREEKFFAMLGLGPLVEGYSLLATTEHTPSMLDLTQTDAELLCDFTQHVREVIMPHYGEAVITEHGRVAPCLDRDLKGKETRCFHAHRLVFPTTIDLSNTFAEHGLETEEYPDFIECWKRFSWKGEYLYFERPNGSCMIAAAPMRLVRQFFRYKIAASIGHPELASWTDHPLTKVVERARKQLINTGD